MFSVYTRRCRVQTHSWGNWFYALVWGKKTKTKHLSFSPFPPSSPSLPPSPKMKHVPTCVFDLFLYKKGTIYITFIKSFSIIKYNITLLQKFQIPATIQDKLPIRVHTVHSFILTSFLLFSSLFFSPLNNVQSFMCQQF